MKNTPLHTISRGIAIFACLVILFLAGGWVGSMNVQVNWMLATLGAIAVTTIAAIIWLAGRYSRSISTDEDNEEDGDE